jgi:hypothetical protein
MTENCSVFPKDSWEALVLAVAVMGVARSLSQLGDKEGPHLYMGYAFDEVRG